MSICKVVQQSIVIFVVLITLLRSPQVLEAKEQITQAKLITNPASAVQLFRTTVTLSRPTDRSRLDKLGIKVLSDTADTALVLVDNEQLATLARLRFEPNGTDEINSLVSNQSTGGLRKPLATSLAPLIDLSSAINTQQSAGQLPYADALSSLRSGINMLGPEQVLLLSSMGGTDSDGDGLTDTTEGFWCTNPRLADSDFDGEGDAVEVQKAKDWLGNLRSGPPDHGAPFLGWPMVPSDSSYNPSCVDHDQDGIPDQAELWDLGLNPNLESTDGDKFDDGQELFGITPPSWGALPRTDDAAFIGNSMPGWVKSPGNHPMVAAFPRIKIQLLNQPLHVTIVSTINAGRVFESGEQISYSTSDMTQHEDSIAKTTSISDWTQAGESLEQTVPTQSSKSGALVANNTSSCETPAPYPATFYSPNTNYLTGAGLVCTQQVIDFKAVPDECKSDAISWNNSVGGGLNGSFGYSKLIDLGASINGSHDFGGQTNVSSKWSDYFCVQAMKKLGLPVDNDAANSVNVIGNYQPASGFDLSGGFGGIQYAQTQSGQLIASKLDTIASALNSPRKTKSTASGHEETQAQTNTHTDSVAQTIEHGNQLSTNQQWITTTASDTSKSAELTFSYVVSNTGTDLATQINTLVFNIYIGSDPSPVCTYFLGSNECGTPPPAGAILTNFFPGAQNTYTSHKIPLSLDQLKRLDTGEAISIRVENVTMGTSDEVFYQNAANSGVLVVVDDSAANIGSSIGSYLIPTWGDFDTIQDVIGRYFPYEQDADGIYTAIWTPMDIGNANSGCVESKRFGTSAITWCKHALSSTDWWTVYLNNLDNSTSQLAQVKAAPNSTVFFRFSVDHDLDGFSDDIERQMGTDPQNPLSVPKEELIAGVNKQAVMGSIVSATLSLFNPSLISFNNIDVTQIAPNSSISILNSTVGGGGYVGAGKSVVVGSSIKLPQNLPGQWSQPSHAHPVMYGYYMGNKNRIYSFSAVCPIAGGCDVGSGTWTMVWTDGTSSGSLNTGQGYASPTMLDVGADGVKLSLISGKVYNGDSFTATAQLPTDLFSYKIISEPHTDPLYVVSYNTPQGNHRFIIPTNATNLSSPSDNLASYSGQMLLDPSVQMVTSSAFTATQTQTVTVVVNNPSDVALTDAHVYIHFINGVGVVAAKVAFTQTFMPGPTTVSIPWYTSDFSPTFTMGEDYVVMTYFTDYQGNIINSSGRRLSSFHADPVPVLSIDASDHVWDIGTVAQGQFLKHTVTVANSGYRVLLSNVSTMPGVSLSQSGNRQIGPGDSANYEISLNTGNLVVGPYNQKITVRSSDPHHPTQTIQISGTVISGSLDLAGGSYRLQDAIVNISGTYSSGTWIPFTIANDFGPNLESYHPIFGFTNTGTLPFGIGKYAAGIVPGMASADMFGDGRDGDLVVLAGQTTTINQTVASVTASGNSATPSNSSGFQTGDTVLFHQTQGTTSAGVWEFNQIVAINSATNWRLSSPLSNNYDSTNGHAQVIRVPNYHNVTVNYGGALTAPAWNGTTGGFLVFKANGEVNISGSADMTGKGYRGGTRGLMSSDENAGNGMDGEGYPRASARLTNNSQANGNGGGPGDFWPNGLPWSCGDGGAGGAGGGNGTAGEHGGDITGYGGGGLNGAAVVNSTLTIAVYGGGGGGGASGGRNTCGADGYDGANGGGNLFFFARVFNLFGTATTNGNPGGGYPSGNAWDEGAGGSGAGGNIFVKAISVNLGANRASATGGPRVTKSNGAPNYGGGGGLGRIRAEYCDALTGYTSSPTSSTQKLNCYAIEQVETPPYNQGRLNLPESINGSRSYTLQYGRRLVFSGSGTQTTWLRVPAGLNNSISLDLVVTGVTTTVPITINYGVDGIVGYTGNVLNAKLITNTTPTAAFNAYWAGHGSPSTGTLDIPISVTLGGSGQVLLTNLQTEMSSSMLRNIRLSAQPYSRVSVNCTIGSSGYGPLTLAVDAGDNGSIDWSWTGNVALPYTVDSGNLMTATNAYLTGKSGEVDLPIRFYVPASVAFTCNSFNATPANLPDLSISSLAVSLSSNSIVEADNAVISVVYTNTTASPLNPYMIGVTLTDTKSMPSYVGSALLPKTASGASSSVTIVWNTTGLSGTIPVQITLDPYGHVSETNKANNTTVVPVNIKSRAQLELPHMVLSDDEPVIGKSVTVTVYPRNVGQVTAPATTNSLFQGNADDGLKISDQTSGPLGSGLTTTIQFTWVPTSIGLQRLTVRADSAQLVNQPDRSLNDTWSDIYVGFRGPLTITSGGSDDNKYSTFTGFGFVDEGPTDVTGACNATVQSYRNDPNGRLVYKFDNLLPGHFYHLDVKLDLCGTVARQESVYVNSVPVAGPVDLGDQRTHQISMLLSPSLYAKRTISVSIETAALGGAIVNGVSLADVDYRYFDAGGANDIAYPNGLHNSGYLNGVSRAQWGSLPYQTLRENQAGNSVEYRFDGLNSVKDYDLHLGFYQSSGSTIIQKVQINGADIGQVLTLLSGQLANATLHVPHNSYAESGSIRISVVRLDAGTSAIVNEIALEERTISLATDTCSVQATPNFTELYGDILVNNQPAIVGTTIEALNPRGDVIGCGVVATSGKWGLLRMFGEDTTTDPSTPGMRSGEPIALRVNGAAAVSTPLIYWNNDRSAHQAGLAAGSIEGQIIPVNSGWILISMYLEPPLPLVANVLSSIMGRFDRVLGENGAYDTQLPAVFNSLKEMHSGTSFYQHITSTNSAPALIQGLARPVSDAIPLHPGWNNLGYLSRVTLPVTVALASIEGKYQRVLGIRSSFDTSIDPIFSSLRFMEPGQGYLIYISSAQPVTLTYPAPTTLLGPDLARDADKSHADSCVVNPTPFVSMVYGYVQINSQNAPVGTRIEAVTTDGMVAGCYIVQDAGVLGLMDVFGGDSSTQPPTAGFTATEPINYRINGLPAKASQALSWSNDRSSHVVEITSSIHFTNLPIVIR